MPTLKLPLKLRQFRWTPLLNIIARVITGIANLLLDTLLLYRRSGNSVVGLAHIDTKRKQLSKTTWPLTRTLTVDIYKRSPRKFSSFPNKILRFVWIWAVPGLSCDGGSLGEKLG